MKKIKRTVDNPYGLTSKQRLVIADMGRKIRRGEPMGARESTEKVYSVSSRTSAHVVSNTNLRRANFREALLDEFEGKQILGANGKVNERLAEGLDAVGKDGIDYAARLKYIQEINKVAGVYAPQQIEKKTLSLRADVSGKELDSRIQELTKELES